MMIECKIGFDFNLDGSLEPEVCEMLCVPVGTDAQTLDEVQYDMVCEMYNVPKMNEPFTIDVDSEDEAAVCSELSDYFGWQVIDMEFEPVDK